MKTSGSNRYLKTPVDRCGKNQAPGFEGRGTKPCMSHQPKLDSLAWLSKSRYWLIVSD